METKEGAINLLTGQVDKLVVVLKEERKKRHACYKAGVGKCKEPESSWLQKHMCAPSMPRAPEQVIRKDRETLGHAQGLCCVWMSDPMTVFCLQAHRCATLLCQGVARAVRVGGGWS